VTRKIENAIGSLEGIESIASTVSEGSSVTMIQLMLERDQSEALDDVRAAIGNLRSQLPSEMEQPTVAHLKAMDRPILTYTVSSDVMDEEALPGSSMTLSTGNSVQSRVSRPSGVSGACSVKFGSR
jgi:multidrug efflux pump subunit AcrB